MNYDFGGFATRSNVKCSDGRIIGRDAFKDNDGQTVPLVWNHVHDDVQNVLGHSLLENRGDSVYAYCTFNQSEAGQAARELVEHGDICALSIYANQLKQNGPVVMHGNIREVSLVLAGANPGAYIDDIISHSENNDDSSAIIYNDDVGLFLEHSDGSGDKNTNQNGEKMSMENNNNNNETVGDVLDTLTDKQLKVVQGLIGMIINDIKKNDEDDDEDDEKGEENMKHNVFDNDTNCYSDDVLTHSEMTAIIGDAKKYGSLKESVLAHGIDDIDYLFPDAKTLNTTPEFIKRDTAWATIVMNSVHRSPFSRIKSIFADITEDEARARGYIKGKQKKEEVFGLLKRTTSPQTIYKKQKLDRDDIIDITDFDVVSWMKGEMRIMLEEEIARAILIGDGRLDSDDDKINPLNIRPILSDDKLYTIKKVIDKTTYATDDEKAKEFIRTAIKARKEYKGSGTPTLFTTEDVLTDCLLLEDKMGRVIYDTEEKLRTALRVSKIVTVECMEGITDTNNNNVMGIIVNLSDYNVGADKGGAVSMFDDFDIDYNAQKYLMETRCSGALIKPYSAIAISYGTAPSSSDGV